MIQNQPHLQDYIQVILRRRWIIITFFITLVVTVFIGSLKQKPVYQAKATLMIKEESPNVVSFQEVTPIGASHYQTYRDYYETQYKLIKSRSILSSVMDSLGLKESFFYKKDDPIERFSNIIKVNPARNSQLVELAVEYYNPQVAAKIANEIADEYIRQNLERNINTANQAAHWLSKKIAEQRQKLKDTELALQKYRKEHNINILPQMSGEEAIEDIKAEYAKLQALYENYSQRYTDEHPKMVELKAQINSLKNKIQGLEDVDMGKETMEYGVLEREVQTNKSIYENLLTRLKEIDVSSTLNITNISIIDRAEVPQKPIKPNLKLNLVLAIILGLVGGTGLGFFVDYLDTTIKSAEDIKEILESHFLGSVPDIEEEEDEIKKDKIAQEKPTSSIAEAYRAVRTDILNCISQTQGIKSILITSAEPKAGKTITLTNLGIVLSQLGNKVLLVDGDLRKPQLHRIFNLDRYQGLSEYLSGDLNLDVIIKNTEIENLKVVTSGKISRNPAEIISSGKLEEFIHVAKTRFDFILFDSSPIVSVTDSIILADRVDASVLVVRSGKTFVPIVVREKEKLTNAKARILGVILNDLRIYYGDYYYYRYYRYYTEDDKRKDSTKELSWESKAKVNELGKKLSETWDSLKSDSKRLTSLIKDKFNKHKNINSKKEKGKNIG